MLQGTPDKMVAISTSTFRHIILYYDVFTTIIILIILVVLRGMGNLTYIRIS